MQNITYKTLLVLVSILFLNACSEEWGIDSQPLTVVPTCENRSNDAILSGALTVASGTTISEINGDAELRIWHFKNSTKAVCTLSGEAIIERS